MIEQLKEMFEMQKDFDNQVLSKLGKEYDFEIASKMEIALFVELGELMQELPSYFKFWKQNKQDNRDRALEEYVDALKCLLSLANFYNIDVTGINPYETSRFINDIRPHLVFIIEASNYLEGIELLFMIGKKIGFTWQEIYEIFKKKHAINLERLEEGY